MNKRNLKKPEIKEVKISELKRFFVGMKKTDHIGCTTNSLST